MGCASSEFWEGALPSGFWLFPGRAGCIPDVGAMRWNRPSPLARSGDARPRVFFVRKPRFGAVSLYSCGLAAGWSEPRRPPTEAQVRVGGRISSPRPAKARLGEALESIHPAHSQFTLHLVRKELAVILQGITGAAGTAAQENRASGADQ